MTQAQRDGFRTGFWTVNSLDAIKDVIFWGSNMLTTDYPHRAVAVIRNFVRTLSLEDVDTRSFATALGQSPQVGSGWSSPEIQQPAEEEGALHGV
jgi:hypothetical protein